MDPLAFTKGVFRFPDVQAYAKLKELEHQGLK